MITNHEGNESAEFVITVGMERIPPLLASLGEQAIWVSHFSMDAKNGTTITLAVPEGKRSEVQAAIARFGEELEKQHRLPRQASTR